MEEINNFFSKHPAYKVINIEHVFSPENNNFGSSFCHICVWFSINYCELTAVPSRWYSIRGSGPCACADPRRARWSGFPARAPRPRPPAAGPTGWPAAAGRAAGAARPRRGPA